MADVMAAQAPSAVTDPSAAPVSTDLASTNATAKLAAAMLAGARPPRAPATYMFSFTPFLQTTYNHSLPADRSLCKAYSATGHCSLGSRCPERHVFSGGGAGSGGSYNSFNSLVCKHWLRGLCKKGEGCEFLHEYNLRKMPECNFFLRNGYCSNGDECLYLHIDPRSKLPPCPDYDHRGFCALGPTCSKKHVRKTLCPFYLAGFCPDGRACRNGAHPRWSPVAVVAPQTATETTTAAEGVESERTGHGGFAADNDGPPGLAGGGGYDGNEAMDGAPEYDPTQHGQQHAQPYDRDGDDDRDRSFRSWGFNRGAGRGGRWRGGGGGDRGFRGRGGF